jgi:hypothetical protein
MADRKYTITVEVKDNKDEEIIKSYTKDVDGYLFLDFIDGKIDTIGGADFAKVLSPLIVKTITKKFGGVE